MEFTVNDKEYDLKFGLAFVRQLDEKFKVDYQGVEFGMGVNLANVGLTQLNPATLSDVIKAAATHSGKAPKQHDVDNALDDYADEHDGLEGLFEEVTAEMGKSSTIKASIKKFEEMAAVQEQD